MLKLSNLRLAEQPDINGLRPAAAGLLGIPESGIIDLCLHKLSIDARRKPDVCFVCTLLVTVADEQAVLARNFSNVSQHTVSLCSVSLHTPPERYEFPFTSYSVTGFAQPENPPVIVGTGPAGLFSALCLAEAGIRCIILERGSPVEKRVGDVARFMQGGGFDAASNIQFGEGGAGTFSDGKLSTGINDKRVRFVLERLVEFGAPEDILYLSKPHIGTDRLRGLVRNIRNRLIGLGCDVRFSHTLTDIDISDGLLHSIAVESGGETYKLATDILILAPGNSARDTFEMLTRRGLGVSPKGFSVGVRIEHSQRGIDAAQYGRDPDAEPGDGLAGYSSAVKLPASDYKLVVHLDNGRSVYTFCVCPGGQVVAAASEPGGIVTNGMSRYARDGENCNGALLVSVTPGDFGPEPLDGIDFQRKLEQAAFLAGGGDYSAPAQLVGDFLLRRASTGHAEITPTYKPGVKYCNLWEVLPQFVCDALYTALPEFNKRISGFAGPDAVLTAVETRSSCPVRIEREMFETVGVRGIFPCGEGSGYAGGIMSAAVDGIKCAEAVFSRLIAAER